MTQSGQNQVTMILQRADGIDAAVSDQLLPLVYDELRKLAAAKLAKETPGQTLQPTALVHEAYLRLVGDVEVRWKNRGHFFGAAARSMRQILVNRAIKKRTPKHGGNRRREVLDEQLLAVEPPADRLLALDEALKKLESRDARLGKIVMLRYFAGLSIEDTAKAIELSTATVSRDWQFARAWLAREIGE